MSNTDRPGKSIAFYTDQETLAKLIEMAEEEDRSVSNMITVLINQGYEVRHPYEEKVFKPQ